MTTIATQSIEQLEQEKRALVDTLRSTLNKGRDNNSEWTVLEQIRAIDDKIKHLNQLALLNRVNKEQSEKRMVASLAWEAEQPTEDITTNDGSLHKVKVKKYPKLAALKWCKAVFKGGVLFEISIGRETFRMYETKYESGKPDTYVRPETFNEFLALNDIQPEPITIDAYFELESKLAQANKELENAIKAYEEKRRHLKVRDFQNIGLVEQSGTHGFLYKYTTKTK